MQEKKPWVSPKLEQLAVEKTLGGTLNFPSELYVLSFNSVIIDRGDS